MSPKQVNQISDAIANDGFEYAMIDKSSWKEIDDVEFHKWLYNFKAARSSLISYLLNSGAEIVL